MMIQKIHTLCLYNCVYKQENTGIYILIYRWMYLRGQTRTPVIVLSYKTGVVAATVAAAAVVKDNFRLQMSTISIKRR